MRTSYKSLIKLNQSLPSQPISTQKAKSRKESPQTFAKMCRPCLIITQSCYCDSRINKPFTCSRCLICVSSSVHVISTYYMPKGSWALSYLIDEIRKSNMAGNSDEKSLGNNFIDTWYLSITRHLKYHHTTLLRDFLTNNRHNSARWTFHYVRRQIDVNRISKAVILVSIQTDHAAVGVPLENTLGLKENTRNSHFSE